MLTNYLESELPEPTAEELRQQRWVTAARRLADETFRERLNQFNKWKFQSHTEPVWLAILAEEFGEAAQATVEYSLGVPKDLKARPQLRAKLVRELVQTAASALAYAQALETGEA